MREWLMDNAATVTKVAVALVYILASLIGFVVLAGLVVAFRPESGYLVAVTALTVTYLHIGSVGTVGGRHRLPA
jgi:hypothetical protein